MKLVNQSQRALLFRLLFEYYLLHFRDTLAFCCNMRFYNLQLDDFMTISSSRKLNL